MHSLTNCKYMTMLVLLWSTSCASWYLTETSTMVDLTQPFDNYTSHWVGDIPFTSYISTNTSDPIRGKWFQKDHYCSTTHAGTHMDAPRHFSKYGWTISDIPLNRFVLPAVVVDISHDVGEDPNVHLRPEHLQRWEDDYGPIPPGSFLLVRTGWSRYWNDREKYLGSTVEDESLLKFPSVTPAAARWIVRNTEVYGIGLDSMSLDIAHDTYHAHQTILKDNLVGLENLKNLHLLPPTGAVLIAMPMKMKGLSGAPCRVIAMIP